MRKIIDIVLAAACAVTAVADVRTISLNSLDGGAEWELFRYDDVLGVPGTRISTPGYNVKSSVAGVVPGTTFTAYVEAGKVENPEWGDNIYMVDETYYNRPFWYRTEFAAPAAGAGEHVWLHFDNTHRYADFYLNGVKLSGTASSMRDVKGHMVRTKYDITDLLSDEGDNAVAVLITDPTTKKRRTSSEPYGITCSPSYMSAAGWDWMPYVPGRLSGITGNAYLRITGDAVMEDPWVRSELSADNSHAALSVSAGVRNVGDKPVSVVFRGTITPGDIRFERRMEVEAGTDIQVAFDETGCPQLGIDSPRLWWPNGYGLPELYCCRLECVVDGTVSDSRDITFGVRRYDYETVTNSEGYPVWRMKVNGVPVYLKGGNWGISEYLLRCHGDEYGKKIMLHTDMNFNMIRLWTGCVTDEEFYDYCDRAGIMVWDDFWLYVAFMTGVAEKDAFRQNAREKVRRLRNHPCIAMWCGANETHPEEELDNFLRELIATDDGNDRMYKSCSNDDGLSGSGWWSNQTPNRYFESASNAMAFGDNPYRFTDTSGYGLRTEIGMGTFPNYESVALFIPEESRWPLPDDQTLKEVDNTVWNHHFFGKEGGNANPGDYKNTVNRQYGESAGLEEFCVKAQLLNIECMKGMFEAWNDKMWNDASGLLIWMSNPAYPSFLWQTYDYYYDATGAYWGAKKGCEHVHVQWNSRTGSVKVINTSGDNLEGACVTARVYNIGGTELQKCAMSAKVSVPVSERREAFVLSLDGGVPAGIRFVKLSLTDASGNEISNNFYWYNTASAYDYKALAAIPQADVACTAKAVGDGRYELTLSNRSATVAFAVRIRLVDPLTGERILPVLLDDNFITLMPHEERRIMAEVPGQRLESGATVMLKQMQHAEYAAASVGGASVDSAVADAGDVTVTVPGNGELIAGWGDDAPRRLTLVRPDGTLAFDGHVRPLESVRVGAPGVYVLTVADGVEAVVRKLVIR